MKVNCYNCQKIIKRYNHNIKEKNFCSRECYSDYSGIKVVCNNCNKEFKKKPSEIFENNFCSKDCYKEFKYKRVTTNCTYCNKSIVRKLSEYNKNKNHYCNKICMDNNNRIDRSCCCYCLSPIKTTKPRIREGHCFCKESCVEKWALENIDFNNYKGCLKIQNCGYCNSIFVSYKERFCCSLNCSLKFRVKENHPRWKTEITDYDRAKRRENQEYLDWRRKVFARDNYCCVICGDKKIEAHHLDGWNWCEEKRLDVKNGITLCIFHHNDFHNKYKRGNNTVDQFNEYILTIDNCITK